MEKLPFVVIYFSPEKAIVAAQHYNAAGIYYEQEDPVIVSPWRDEEALSDVLRKALARFSFKDRDLREGKLTDWPSYRASKCRSVRDFESSYSRVSVTPLNHAKLFYRATIQPPGEPQIRLEVFLNPYGSDTEAFALPLVRLFDASSKWDLMLDVL